MTQNFFLSLATAHENEQTIKKSRFIGYAAPIKTEADATLILDQVQAQHAKANHAAFAYVAGDHDDLTRQSDAGEPVGTAGSPILNVIQQNQLHNIIIVVTRFFGGIKLGAGGLIRAYGSTASLSIEDAQIVVRKALT
ncbi:MAG TPA: YigZ family protein, partial [Lactobacillus sp.]|nr:YigZ family protein [Lactobacillus sp.]